MREIKFRGLSVDGGGWVYGWLVPRSIIEDPDTLDKYWIATGFEDEVVPVVEETVGQFCGRNDKNGTPIFEGDIISFPSGNLKTIDDGCGGTFEKWFPCVKSETVKWSNANHGGYTMLSHTCCDGSYSAEVTGNIHQQEV